VLRHTTWRGKGGYSLKTKSLQDVKYRRQIENKRKVDIFFRYVEENIYRFTALYVFFVTHRAPFFPWFECVVGGVRHPQHTQTISNSSTIAADNTVYWLPDAVVTVVLCS
jgi:hypothetical protein